MAVQEVAERKATAMDNAPGQVKYFDLGGAMRSYWIAVVVLVVAGLAAGIGAASFRHPTYMAEAKLNVGSSGISSNSIPGYAQAVQQLAGNMAETGSSDSIVSDASTALGLSLVHNTAGQIVIAGYPPAQHANTAKAGGNPTGHGSASSKAITSNATRPYKNPSGYVQISGVPQSSIVLIDATASSKALAVRFAQDVANAIVKYTSTPVNNSPLQTQYQTVAKQYESDSATADLLASQLSQLEVPNSPLAGQFPGAALQTQISNVQQQLVQARTAADIDKVQMTSIGAELSSSTPGPSTSLVNSAISDGTNKSSRLQEYGSAGAVAGLLIGILAAIALERRGRRKLNVAS